MTSPARAAPTLPTSGGFHVLEALHGSAACRSCEDMPFAKSLNIEAGYRYSDYNLSFGSTNTYKLGLEWAPINDVRVRGMYQPRGARAEQSRNCILQPRVQLDGTVDPCAGATPTATAAQCARSGVTRGGEYGHIAGDPPSSTTASWAATPKLQPEKADTYTLGLVFTPSFLPDFTATVDYYNIQIKNVITTLGANFIIKTCLSSNPFL